MEIKMKIQEIMNYILQKLKEALLYVENFGSEALAWFDNVFPPETRKSKISHWFHVAQPFLIAAVIFGLVVCLCRCCYRCCCRGRGMVRMMKAPGRAGVSMPRSVFEGNPKAYFLNLRANPGPAGLHLC